MKQNYYKYLISTEGHSELGIALSLSPHKGSNFLLSNPPVILRHNRQKCVHIVVKKITRYRTSGTYNYHCLLVCQVSKWPLYIYTSFDGFGEARHDA